MIGLISIPGYSIEATSAFYICISAISASNPFTEDFFKACGNVIRDR
jgi:hypothetical protein